MITDKWLNAIKKCITYKVTSVSGGVYQLDVDFNQEQFDQVVADILADIHSQAYDRAMTVVGRKQ
jgi:hypothetical protein